MSTAASTPRSKYLHSSEPRDGRDEMNIAEFPIALLSDRASANVNTLEFQDSVRDPKSGHTVTRKLTVMGTAKLGLPTARDDEVLLGLIQLTRLKNNFTDRTVHFSRYELIQLLGWNDEGKNYRRIDESMHRWASVYLRYDKAWWDNRAKSWVDQGFHVIGDITLYDQENHRRHHAHQSTLPFSSFVWSDIFFRSFEDGYLKAIDLNFYLGLQSTIAKRIYRFLDKHFWRRAHQEYDLEDFALEHVGLSRVCHTGQIKEKLAPAIRELEEKEFLETMPTSERYLQVRRGEWKVIFEKKATAVEDKTKAKETAPKALEKELIDRGVTLLTAAELVAAFPAERITLKLEVFDWFMENKDKRLAQNPAGYLVKSIRDDYAAPAGFEPRAEREQKKRDTEQRRQKKAEEQATKRRQEQEETTHRKAERAHIEAYLKTLTPQERIALEEQAINHADEKMRETAQAENPFGNVARRLLVDREVLRISPLPENQPS
jgi:Replication initiator protein A